MIYDGNRTCRCNKFGLPHRLDQCTLILSRNPSDGIDFYSDEEENDSVLRLPV